MMDVNRVPKPFLDFDDPGASDDEAVKGITAGDIRAWHDQYDRLLSSWADCRESLWRERRERQNAFDLGFKAAGGSIYTLNEDPSGQRREPMTPHPLDDENPMEHIARDIRAGIFPKRSA